MKAVYNFIAMLYQCLWYEIYMLAFLLAERAGAILMLFNSINIANANSMQDAIELAANENTTTRDYCLQTFKH